MDDAALKRLPSLVKLRNALYSPRFRAYISSIAGAGPLSGSKTDMAVNVYTEGCHLLCHDDVIGSRRVSYILYLTDPDEPWQAEWGGALRLYPTEKKEEEDGQTIHLPSPEFSKVIPPAWNQLSFFAVQPGESFHDVEEVYARGFERFHEATSQAQHKPSNGKASVQTKGKGKSKTVGTAEQGGRVRMAISGWFHIPQRGEPGFEEGAEERQAERSSLAQLQGKADAYDLPQPRWIGGAPDDDAAHLSPDEAREYSDEAQGEVELSEADLTFLLKYMNPRYLTPDTVLELAEVFADESSLRLGYFLNDAYAAALHPRILAADSDAADADHPPGWTVARPPHKHRYLFRQPASTSPTTIVTSDTPPPASPVDDLINTLLPSPAFRKWLALATGCTLRGRNILARRFRPGLDYTLATAHEAAAPRLELCLGLTPTPGWGDDDAGDEAGKPEADADADPDAEAVDVGGYEVYMAGDDDDDDAAAAQDPATHTGAGKRRSGKADPAIYAGGDADADDGILFSMPAGWNNASIVLRDRGVLRFVKYVSSRARGARWDVVGEWGVVDDDDEDEEGDDGGEEEGEVAAAEDAEEADDDDE